MTHLFRLLAVIMVAVSLSFGADAQKFKLQFEPLEQELEHLTTADRDIVSDAINLIKASEHSLALARLSDLKERSPQNSSLRILVSYALLQAGNLLGAFEEAQQAHAAPNGNHYKCWFLAKVALLNGKHEVCAREIEHVRSTGEMVAEVNQLEKELKKN